MGNKRKREREKKVAINAAKEAQRRAAQSAKDKQRRKITSTKDIIAGYVQDILNMIKYKVEVSSHIKMRLKQAEALKEAFPEKFNQLRIDELKEAQEAFEVIAKQIDSMAAQVGMLEDMTTFQEKMKFVSEHAGDAAMAQMDFDLFGNKLNAIDKRYVESFAKIQKGEDLTDTLEAAGVDFEQESKKLDEEMKDESKVEEIKENPDEVNEESHEVKESIEEEKNEVSMESENDVFMEVPVSDEEAKQIILESKSED